jgi:hypothetical protein
MKNVFRNDLYYLLEELGGDYELNEKEIEVLAYEKLSKTRMTPVEDLQRALRIEQGLEEPDFAGDSIVALDDWQTYRFQEYNEVFVGPYPPAFDDWEALLKHLQENDEAPLAQSV